MTSRELCEIAGRLMRQPAAPYFEDAVRAEAMNICREHGLSHELDQNGNLIVRLQTARGVRPIALAAHLDHPGFHVQRRKGGGLAVQFHGGVSAAHFRPGLRIRLIPGAVPARLGRKLAGDRRFEVAGNVPAGARPQFAVWELEDFAVRRGRIVARACDDLGGVAVTLATLVELKRRRAKVNVIGAISRAEEVGFHGALMLAEKRRLPLDTLVISLETSRELPPTKMGAGVIVRVGDRTSIFDSDATRFLTEVAAGIQRRDSRFQFQRALMSGGTCEATAYQEYGYQTAAVCVALGNYHNCAPGHRIAAEFVCADDLVGMQRLLAETARSMPRFDALVAKLPARLRKLARQADRALRGKRRWVTF
ncbi:MAG TPA: M20/M25/M40 family metallo-hydrolase [Verrucomicrobiae bacterium]|jgi:endoglucanase